MKFIHKYIGYNDGYDEYVCNIEDDKNNYVGYCKYINNFMENAYSIEYIAINEENRYKGYATAMVKELISKKKLIWDGRFTCDGRNWYNSLLKKGIV